MIIDRVLGDLTDIVIIVCTVAGLVISLVSLRRSTRAMHRANKVVENQVSLSGEVDKLKDETVALYRQHIRSDHTTAGQ